MLLRAFVCIACIAIAMLHWTIPIAAQTQPAVVRVETPELVCDLPTGVATVDHTRHELTEEWAIEDANGTRVLIARYDDAFAPADVVNAMADRANEKSHEASRASVTLSILGTSRDGVRQRFEKGSVVVLTSIYAFQVAGVTYSYSITEVDTPSKPATGDFGSAVATTLRLNRAK